MEHIQHSPQDFAEWIMQASPSEVSASASTLPQSAPFQCELGTELSCKIGLALAQRMAAQKEYGSSPKIPEINDIKKHELAQDEFAEEFVAMGFKDLTDQVSPVVMSFQNAPLGQFIQELIASVVHHTNLFRNEKDQAAELHVKLKIIIAQSLSAHEDFSPEANPSGPYLYKRSQLMQNKILETENERQEAIQNVTARILAHASKLSLESHLGARTPNQKVNRKL